MAILARWLIPLLGLQLLADAGLPQDSSQRLPHAMGVFEQAAQQVWLKPLLYTPLQDGCFRCWSSDSPVKLLAGGFELQWIDVGCWLPVHLPLH